MDHLANRLQAALPSVGSQYVPISGTQTNSDCQKGFPCVVRLAVAPGVNLETKHRSDCSDARLHVKPRVHKLKKRAEAQLRSDAPKDVH